MFPVQQSQEEKRISVSTQYSFAGGINNTTSSLDRLEDDEAIDILNFRFDESDSLISRNGTEKILDKISGANITTKITSIYRAVYSNATSRDLFTTDNKIYEIIAGVPSNRTGAVVISPAGVKTQWRMYNDIAIGVPRLSVPFKVAAGVGNAAVLGGTPPAAKYIEVWNDRVWLTGTTVTSENRLFGSFLGNPEDWTTGSGTASGIVTIDIEPEDGDKITGIIAFRERLFIFKRNRIYTVQAIGGAAPTDATALSVELYTSSIGCMSAYSIQPVLDDVLFLAEGAGIASLVASERVGDFQSALLSRKVRALR